MKASSASPSPRSSSSRWTSVSVWLNVVLLAALSWKLPPAATLVETPAVPANPVPGGPDHPRRSPAVAPSGDDVADGPPPSVWVDQLRKLGVPETTLAEIVSQYFNARDLEEAESLRAASGARGPGAESLAALDLRQRLEKKDSMREALGADAFRRWDRDRALRESGLHRLTLSAAEGELLHTLLSGLEDARTRIQLAQERGEIDPHDTNARDAELIKNHEARLQALLGPERTAQHLNPPEASPEAALREQLGAYAAPAEKFAALLAVDKEWNARVEAQRATLSDETIDGLLRERDLAYQRTLGPEEYERFKRANDPAVCAMIKYAKAWKLAPSDIEHSYRLLRDHRARLASAPETERDAVRESSRQSLLLQLGPERFQRFDRAGLLSPVE